MVEEAMSSEKMLTLLKKYLDHRGSIIFALKVNKLLTATTHCEKAYELSNGHTLVGFAGLVYDPN